MASPYDIANQVEATIGRPFQDRNLFIEVLKAAGSGTNFVSQPGSIDGHKRLAHVGDAVLKMVALDEWYYSGEERVMAQNRIQKLGSHFHLATCGQALGLHAFIMTNVGQQGQLLSPAMIARTIQALIGAVWLDSGRNFEETRMVIQKLNL